MRKRTPQEEYVVLVDSLAFISYCFSQLRLISNIPCLFVSIYLVSMKSLGQSPPILELACINVPL
jgi:hypothetical protein